MLAKLFAAFVIVPILEIYIIIKVGTYIGAGWTIVLVIGTAFLGAYLAKMQGAHTMMKMRANMQQGIPPTNDILDAFLIFAAGLVFPDAGISDGYSGSSGPYSCNQAAHQVLAAQKD